DLASCERHPHRASVVDAAGSGPDGSAELQLNVAICVFFKSGLDADVVLHRPLIEDDVLYLQVLDEVRGLTEIEDVVGHRGAPASQRVLACRPVTASVRELRA